MLFSFRCRREFLEQFDEFGKLPGDYDDEDGTGVERIASDAIAFGPTLMMQVDQVREVIDALLEKRGKQKKGVKDGLRQNEHRKHFFDFIKRVWSTMPCAQTKYFNEDPTKYTIVHKSADQVLTILSEAVHKFLFRGLASIRLNGETVALITAKGNLLHSTKADFQLYLLW